MSVTGMPGNGSMPADRMLAEYRGVKRVGGYRPLDGRQREVALLHAAGLINLSQWPLPQQVIDSIDQRR